MLILLQVIIKLTKIFAFPQHQGIGQYTTGIHLFLHKPERVSTETIGFTNHRQGTEENSIS